LVTQRGVGRQRVFFAESDYEAYKDLLVEGCQRAGVTVLAWCLLPQRVHLVLVPKDKDGLRAALGETHRRYSRQVNVRKARQGYLWRSRFASFPFDEGLLDEVIRFVELSPVRENLVRSAAGWSWSSAQAHSSGRADGVLRAGGRKLRNWKASLKAGLNEEQREKIESASRTGRPLGSVSFVKQLEKQLGRTLQRQKPGPKPKRRRKK
jgi:putative transposase